MKEMLDATMMRRSLIRMAHEIVERNKGTENVVLVGIKGKGVPIAKRLSEIIASFEEAPVPYAELDIRYWRDDHKKSDEKAHELALEVHDKKVVLCDDVLFTGRSVRAAMDAIMDHGRAKEIQLAILVDRGHRELPIRADFVGKNIPTSIHENVIVKSVELDGIDGIYLETKRGLDQ